MAAADEEALLLLQGASKEELLQALVVSDDSFPSRIAEKIRDQREKKKKLLDEESERRRSRNGSGGSCECECEGKKKKKKKKSGLDFSKARFHQIAIKFMYDGSELGGLATQLRAEDGKSDVENLLPAVEDHLFDAMIKTRMIEHRKSACYSRCGRTDKGVSAFGQVVSFRARCPLSQCGIPLAQGSYYAPEEEEEEQEEEQEEEMKRMQKSPCCHHYISHDYCQALNKALPMEIRCIFWAPVPDAFSARFCSTGRTYRYFFIRRGRDIDAMDRAAHRLVGDHDFRNLCKMNPAQITNFRRIVRSARVRSAMFEEQGCEREVCVFEIEGVAFLWHQIRCIMSVLFMVGDSLEDPDIIDHLLDIEACPARPYYKMADDKPLVLHDCAFQGIPLQLGVSNLVGVQTDLERMWEEAMLKCARIKDAMNELATQTVHARELLHLVNGSTKSGKKRKTSVASITSEAESDLLQRCHDQQSLSWKDALCWLREHRFFCTIIPGHRPDLHTKSLRNRAMGPSLDERVGRMANTRLERRMRNIALKDANESGFHTKMQAIFTNPAAAAAAAAPAPADRYDD